MHDAPVLIVGAGLIGSAVARAYREHGFRVACADADAARAWRLSAELGCHAQHFDLTAAGSVADVLMDMRPAVVVHAAGRFRARTPGEVRALVLDASRGAANLARAAVAARVGRLLLVSSVAVYGQHRGAISEETPTGGKTPYGLAKNAAETALLDHCLGTGTVPLIARLAGVYGGAERAGGWLNNALSEILRSAVRTKAARIPAFLGGHDYLHVRDAAAGVCLVAERGTSGAYNIGYGTPVELADIASALTALGVAVRWQEEDSTSYRWWLDIAKARAELGFTARMTLTDGLQTWADQICHEELCQ
jgi:nucleoside-diphosphate-sugar epimerase